MSDPAIRVRRRAYPAKGKAIAGLRLVRKLDPEQLCRKARINPKTLARLENGEAAYVSTLTRVAAALGVGLAEIADELPQPDAVPELVSPRLCVITVTLNIQIDKFDELQGPLELLSALKKFGLSGEFDVNGVSEGSTKVEFIGTLEDWVLLRAAQRTGLLAELSVDNLELQYRLVEPEPVARPVPPLPLFSQPRPATPPLPRDLSEVIPKTSARRHRRRVRACIGVSALCLLCAFAGIGPLPGPQIYVVAGILAVVIAFLGKWAADAYDEAREREGEPGVLYFRVSAAAQARDGPVPTLFDLLRQVRWWTVYFPLLALVLNVVAALAWPWCVGFERTPEGYRFGIVNRDPAWVRPGAQP